MDWFKKKYRFHNPSCYNIFSKRKTRKAVEYLGILLIFTTSTYLLYKSESSVEKRVATISPVIVANVTPQVNEIIRPPKKLILIRSDFMNRWKKFFGILSSSEVNDCIVTDQTNLVEPHEWDAVMWDFKPEDLAEVLKGKRNPKTYYVFNTKNWPHRNFVNIINNNNLNGAFNLTMTYRKDSDIVVPFYKLKKLKEKVETPIPDQNSRQKLAFWEGKFCHTDSEREILLSTLKKYIEIDTYGDCGTMKCNLSSEKECDLHLTNKYKFHFVLEKSLCQDYLTEEINKAFRLNAIPVVYGIGLKKLDLPPNSYIDVLDFPSVKRLAEYLLYLNQNVLAYKTYLKWKSEYSFTVDSFRTEAMQELCEFLHRVDDVEATDSLFKPPTIDLLPGKPNSKIQMPAPANAYSSVVIDGTTKMYKNITQWFHTDICISPKTNKGLKSFISGNEPVGDTPKQISVINLKVL